MVTFFVLVLLGLVLLFAGLELLSRYRAEIVVGSAEWNAHQLRLRDHVDALPDGEDEPKREAYERRLELQAARGIYADEEERRRARVLALHEDLYRSREQSELFEKLHGARRED